ncbi:MAG: UDP-N-acetylglucosamine 4,6-dehydratase [Saprospiraceae bacterium]|nr:UDP-N-acetylglucosamine 4,6-dehydratase [Saprospiraceae bacterium]MDW8485335.1 UDP-N-acetylglucosamine 4,6-dehydratase [Saprospiraceae bacterium]
MDFEKSTLELLGRNSHLFEQDINKHDAELRDIIKGSRFLVIGGAGTIGQAVAKEIFKRNPKALHVVDISENNLVEFVRDVRSTLGYINGEFKTFAIDCGSIEFESMYEHEGPYDYVLNLSALKHVRSEKDPYTLMRMIDVNVFNTTKTIKMAREANASKYFCVSTDKAANPVNMMGASKRIMELFVFCESEFLSISMARFANVAFSDGSLLHGFDRRFEKRQPFAAPSDVQRYFMTKQESGELCLLSCLLGHNRDIFIPKMKGDLHLIRFSEIAIRYLHQRGYEPYICDSEDEARTRAEELIAQRKWPCFFFESDTTGEKETEEFYTDGESVDLDRFESVGVIVNRPIYDREKLDHFKESVHQMRISKSWSKADLLQEFRNLIPNFAHIEKGKHLDQRM